MEMVLPKSWKQQVQACTQQEKELELWPMTRPEHQPQVPFCKENANQSARHDKTQAARQKFPSFFQT